MCMSVVDCLDYELMQKGLSLSRAALFFFQMVLGYLEVLVPDEPVSEPAGSAPSWFMLQALA